MKISLAAARINAHLTQTEVAKKLSVSRQTVSNWERGRNDLTLAQAWTLSQLYKISINNIALGG